MTGTEEEATEGPQEEGWENVKIWARDPWLCLGMEGEFFTAPEKQHALARVRPRL